MRKTGRSRIEEQTAAKQWRLPLGEFFREALLDTVVIAGFAFAQEQLEAERAMLCGPRYAHNAERTALRAGHAKSSLTLGGRRAEIDRPRVRSRDRHELGLPSWEAWSARDPLTERAVEQMLLGVSSRRYARSLEPLPDPIEVHGVSKSAVSERFVVGTAKKLAELMRRKLHGLKLIAVMIDGVRFADHVVLAAVGIDINGKKHVLGLREGATENAAVCKALLADLIERGLPTNRSLLFVIDGAKALRKAVTDTFGSRALIQRCRQHSVPGRAHSKEVRVLLLVKPSSQLAWGRSWQRKRSRRSMPDNAWPEPIEGQRQTGRPYRKGTQLQRRHGNLRGY